MDIFRFLFKKSNPIILRCTHCYFDYELSTSELRLLENRNPQNSLCPVLEPCPLCNIGFLIPVKYTGKDGKHYFFYEIKPKIKNNEQNLVIEPILDIPTMEIIVSID